MNKHLTGILKEWGLIIVMMVILVVVHLIFKNYYELHRDELLYIALSEHLSWGYVSVPPSIAFFAALSRFLFGETALAIGFFPAVMGALTLLVTCLIVKELKGGNVAVFITGLAFLLSTSYLRTFSLFQPVCFDVFYWTLSAYLIIRLINTRNPRIWVYLFIVWGLAFLNKYMIVFFVAGFFMVLLATPLRKLLRSWYFPVGVLAGLIIIFPNLLWQVIHRLPVIHHMQELRATQLVNVEQGGFLLMQLLMNFPGLIVWISGLVYLLVYKQARPYRLFGYLYIVVLVLFFALKGKAYYTLGLYPFLLAAGGYYFEKHVTGRMTFLRYAVILFIIVFAIPGLPFGLPVLRADPMVRYGQVISRYISAEPLRWEDGNYYSLPQDYADMTGWKELAEITAGKYQGLTPWEQAECVIFAENYGEAGAICFYGKKYGLPEPYCFNESFIFHAPDHLTATHFIKIGESDDLPELFNHYELTGRITDPYARESGLPVYYCWDPKPYLYRLWDEKVKKIKERYKFKRPFTQNLEQ